MLIDPRFGAPAVQRISLPWMFEITQAIDGLDRIAPEGKLVDHWYSMFDAKNKLGLLLNQSVYAYHLRVSRQKATELENLLNSFVVTGPDDEKKMSQFDVWRIRQGRDAFRTVFLSELLTLPTFLVGEKEGFDLNTLIDNGWKLFPASMVAKVPEAIADAMEAGKALAYELPTSCGFHVYRIVEAVLKRYWDVASTGAARPNLETIGNYATELERGKYGEPKVWEALKQLAKLHRNPLIHPEVILSTEEAIGTIGMSRSVIGLMLGVIPDAPPTTGGIATAVV